MDEELLAIKQNECVRIQASLDKPVIMRTEYYHSDQEELAIDIWMPNKEMYPGKRPGILFFFGGGFYLGTRKTYQKHCEYLARQGYVAMTADYRIRSLYPCTPEDAYRDGAAAWIYVRENADQWSLDFSRTVLAGGSAGGMIAAMCSRLTNINPFALILYCPGVLDEQKGPEKLSSLTGTEVDGKPVLNVRFAEAGDPPMLILHGEKDTSVPIANVRKFVEYAREQGVEVEFIAYADAIHGLSGYNQGREYFYLSIGETLRFLNKLNGIDSW